MEPAIGGPAEWEAIIGRFIADHVRRARAEGIVLGMSGGLDSAVVGALAARAIGPDRVTGFLMPASDSDPQDAEHGLLACRSASIACETRGIGPIIAGVVGVTGELEPAVLANAKARARMTILYAEGQASGRLVSGTGNKSELLVGYFTKHGDGGNDLQPIGDLYKTQVVELARHLGVPAPIIEKPPSAGLWAGQTDEAELGMSYATLDAVLKGIELNQGREAIGRRTGIDAATVDRVWRLVRTSEHKRRPPLVPKIGARTVGVDWRRPVHWDA